MITATWWCSGKAEATNGKVTGDTKVISALSDLTRTHSMGLLSARDLTTHTTAAAVARQSRARRHGGTPATRARQSLNGQRGQLQELTATSVLLLVEPAAERRGVVDSDGISGSSN